MKDEKVTVEDLKTAMSSKGIRSDIKQEKVITRLQVNGCLIAMVSDILDQLITDEQSMAKTP